MVAIVGVFSPFCRPGGWRVAVLHRTISLIGDPFAVDSLTPVTTGSRNGTGHAAPPPMQSLLRHNTHNRRRDGKFFALVAVLFFAAAHPMSATEIEPADQSATDPSIVAIIPQAAVYHSEQSNESRQAGGNRSFATFKMADVASRMPKAASGMADVARRMTDAAIKMSDPAMVTTVTRVLFPKAKRTWDAPGSRLEEEFLTDAADGRLDAFTPLSAALVASGTEDTDCLHRYEQKVAALADDLRRSENLYGAPRERAEAIFEFLHRRVLGNGYDLAYTDIRRVLDEGRFNCVSATVLFNYFAGQCGLDCRGLEMPGHAMSRLILADGMLDIENTSPRWCCWKDDPRQSVSASSKMIGAPASADRSKAREVSPIQVAAMIYYNRGVDLLAEKRFAEAAKVNAKALRLDPTNATARGNLLATINNWSIELGNTKQFSEAVDLLRQGLALDPKFEAFAQNYVHVHHQWVDHLCGQQRFEEAITILSRASAEMPDRDYLRKAQDEVRQRWAHAAADSTAK